MKIKKSIDSFIDIVDVIMDAIDDIILTHPFIVALAWGAVLYFGLWFGVAVFTILAFVPLCICFCSSSLTIWYKR